MNVGAKPYGVDAATVPETAFFLNMGFHNFLFFAKI